MKDKKVIGVVGHIDHGKTCTTAAELAIMKGRSVGPSVTHNVAEDFEPEKNLPASFYKITRETLEANYDTYLGDGSKPRNSKVSKAKQQKARAKAKKARKARKNNRKKK